MFLYFSDWNFSRQFSISSHIFYPRKFNWSVLRRFSRILNLVKLEDVRVYCQWLLINSRIYFLRNPKAGRAKRKNLAAQRTRENGARNWRDSEKKLKTMTRHAYPANQSFTNWNPGKTSVPWSLLKPHQLWSKRSKYENLNEWKFSCR